MYLKQISIIYYVFNFIFQFMSKKRIYTLFIIAIALSLISLGLSFYHHHRLQEAVTWDSLGILVGILSLLVTVLIGWQIYTIINVKEELNSVQKFKSDTQKQLQLYKVEIQKEIQEAKDKIRDEGIRNISFMGGYTLKISKGNAPETIKYLFNQHFINLNENGFAEELSYSLLTTIIKKTDIKFDTIKELVKDVPFNELEAFTHRVLTKTPPESSELKELIKRLLKET